MKIYTLQLGEMGNCTYIVENDNLGLIIDPSWQMQTIYKTLEENKITPKAVLLTHGHYDHLTGAEKLLEKYKIKAYIGKEDIALSGLPQNLLIILEGNTTLEIAGMQVNFIHTPGHTPGSYSIKIDNNLFTGDTLFAGSIGRTDFPGGSAKEMQKSLVLLSKLPKETEVYCGHSYGPSFKTTIGEELKNNPFMQMATREPDTFGDIL